MKNFDEFLSEDLDLDVIEPYSFLDFEEEEDEDSIDAGEETIEDDDFGSLDQDVDFEDNVTEPSDADDEVEVSLEVDKDTMGKVVIFYAGIHDFDKPDPVMDMVNKVKEQLDQCECQIIRLYQLNIQPVQEEEPADGMYQIYEHLKNSDALIFASPVKSGSPSSLLETLVARLNQHYTGGELEYRVFGSLMYGEEAGNWSEDLIRQLNNLGLIIPPNGHICTHPGDEMQLDEKLNKFSKSIKSMVESTEDLRVDILNGPSYDQADLMDFDQFADRADSEELTDTPVMDEEPSYEVDSELPAEIPDEEDREEGGEEDTDADEPVDVEISTDEDDDEAPTETEGGEEINKEEKPEETEEEQITISSRFEKNNNKNVKHIKKFNEMNDFEDQGNGSSKLPAASHESKSEFAQEAKTTSKFPKGTHDAHSKVTREEDPGDEEKTIITKGGPKSAVENFADYTGHMKGGANK